MREARRRKVDPEWGGQSPPRGERGTEPDWLLEKQEEARAHGHRETQWGYFVLFLKKVIGTH